MRPLDPRLLAHAKAARSHILTAVGIGVLSAVLVIAQATVLGSTLADVFGGSPGGIPRALTILAAIGVSRAVLAWAAEATAARASASVKSELRRAALVRIAQLGPAWVHRSRTSDVSTVLVRGLDALDPYFARYLPTLVLAAVVPAAGGIWILRQDPLSAAIIAVTIPLVPFFMILVGRFTQSETDRQWRSLQTLAGHFLDVVTGISTLKAFNRSEGQAEALARTGEEYRISTMRVLRVSFLSALVLELISTVSVALVAVSIGLRLDAGSFTLRQGLIILILVPDVYLPLRAVGTQFHAAAEGMQAAGQVLDIIETPVCDGHDGHRQINDAAVVTFQDVSHTYPGSSAPALRAFTAEFHRGRVTALTGPSGCGKTTALSLLMKFTAVQSGSVAVDGVEVGSLATASLRSHIGYLPQTPWIPHGTVREVLSAAGPVPDERLAHICRQVGLGDLALGLDTVVSRSSGASAGQRRRLALARLLLNPAPIMVLDEPSASVDAATEDAIIAIMRELAQAGAMVIVVSHRDSVLSSCDTVIELAAL